MSERIDEISKKWSFLGAKLSDDDINDLFLEIEDILSNQIPGRCGECEYWTDLHHGFGQCVHDTTDNAKNWPAHGFCHEWDPKEDV